MTDYMSHTIESIKKGYSEIDIKNFQCLHCNKTFDADEIFPINGRFYTAEKAVIHHIGQVHGSQLESLMNLDKKLTSLTDNQKEILTKMAAGASDKEIANDLGLSASTIRHLRFSMKEKAKQAKVFLALYELVFDQDQLSSVTDSSPEQVPIHTHATMVDDRYLTTLEEQAQIIERFFVSLKPLKLKTFSTKEKNKIIILKTIAAELDVNKSYSEKELSAVLHQIYDDYATLRRYLIEYGFMERSKDGSAYTVTR